MKNSREVSCLRTTCRGCKSPRLTAILSLGSHYVSNFVEHAPDQGPRVPLNLVLCDVAFGGCGLLQLSHTTSPELLYRHYWYRSVVNATMRKALANICNSVEALAELAPGDIVLDIGCNDGTLLRSYRCREVQLIGFEPARNLIKEAEVGTTRIINNFFNAEDFRAACGDNKARVITSIAMFYDLEDPNEFVHDVKGVLAQGGIWVIQMSYLPAMLEQNAFDNICHEHLEYYSLMSLKKLLDRHQLEIFDAELNDVNGGSFRAYVKHAGQPPRPIVFQTGRVEALARFEMHLGLYERAIYDAFAARVNEEKVKAVDFVRREVARGKRVYGYGASTKGNTLLQFYGLDERVIVAAAERNPDKWGKRTVGSNVPIISEEEARAQKPDYFLVLPWHFLPEFLDREKPFLEAGGRFVVPLPRFVVIP